jgi:transcriptional regulator with XRE-family HTH domain
MVRRTKKAQILKDIGEAIRDHRIFIGWSQEELSFHCRLHRTYVGAVERGERNISILSLKKIADALNIQIAALFRGRKEQHGNTAVSSAR